MKYKKYKKFKSQGKNSRLPKNVKNGKISLFFVNISISLQFWKNVTPLKSI
jgi:hypothetical protein